MRDPLDLDKKVLIRAERISKKDAPINIYKPTMENISFFNRQKKCIIKKRLKVSKNPLICYYWFAPKDDAENINDERFIRQELFAINDEFV